MPYPAQTDRESIVAATIETIEAEGIEGLSLAGLAAKLGIKAPSLYRHIPNKTALLQAVVVNTFERLFAAYQIAIETTDGEPIERLMAIALAHRAFAIDRPRTYVLAFTIEPEAERADDRFLEQLVLPIQELMATLVGAENSLTALRGTLAILHGFVMLEIADRFRRGGDLNAAFESSVRVYLSGWEARSTARQ